MNASALSVLLALTGFVAASTHAAFFDASVAPQDGELFLGADYSLWIPDGQQPLRALIVRQHGCGRNGITQPFDLQWQALARKWNAALMGSWLRPGSTNCPDWSNPANGSDRSFAAALAQFAGKSKHSELTRAPWVLWGHSGGAMWAMGMLQRHPQRVVAVFAQSGSHPGTNSAAAITPVMFCRGAQDFDGAIQRINDSFHGNRPMGALWSVAINPTARHECGHSRDLAIPFFDEILSQRLPGTNFGNALPLIPSYTSRNWLGDPATLDIAPSASFKGDISRANWFPNESLARQWQEFSRSGAVKDTTPPLAPFGLKAKSNKRTGVTLTWQAAADLESGLKTFVIYRDGKRIGSLKGDPNTAAKGWFQAGNYGDEPEPPRPLMYAQDDQAAAGPHTYEISAVNWHDLESPKSAAAQVNAKSR